MLTDYHAQYATKSEAEILQRAWVKERELRQVFMTIGFPRCAEPVARVAGLGCVDVRLLPHRQRIFELLLERPVHLTTYDIAVEHLQAFPNVFQHDVTNPFPGGPYDVVFSDLLIRFIPPEKQQAVLLHAYNALVPGGISVHTFAEEDFYPERAKTRVLGAHPVDFLRLQRELSALGMHYLEIPFQLEAPVPGTDEKQLVRQWALVLKK